MSARPHLRLNHVAVLLCLCGLALLLLIEPAFAASETTGSGLSKRMYCYVFNIFSGQIGLLIGLIIATIGLWRMISGKGFTGGLFLILVGALLSSLTSIIESGLESFSNFIGNAKIAEKSFDKQSLGFESLGVGRDLDSCNQIKVPDYVEPEMALKNARNANGTNNPYDPGNTGYLDPVAADGTVYRDGAPVNSCAEIAAGKKCPKGIRNNNPGNIRALPGRTYPGQIGVDKDGFAVFDTMEHGIDRMAWQLQRYSDRYGKTTIAEQINRWAPPMENNTGAYVNQVVSYMRKNGLDVNANSRVNLSDPAFRSAYTRAIMKHENGMEVGH